MARTSCKKALPGARWERKAESFLHHNGLTTVDRNFRCRLGEIDLIMEHGACLVFAEIRYRQNSFFGSGAASVTRAKQVRLIRAAQKYLQLNQHRAQQTCRFDVLSMGQTGGEMTYEWIKNAFC